MNNIKTDCSNTTILNKSFDITKINEILCDDLFLYKICPYVNPKWLKYTNKENYEKYSYCVKDELNGTYQSYLRYIIRNDFDYCLKHQLGHHRNIFLKKKKIRYKNKRFTNLLHFIFNLSNEYNANKCKDTIKELFSDSLKKYKNNTTYNNKWSN